MPKYSHKKLSPVPGMCYPTFCAHTFLPFIGESFFWNDIPSGATTVPKKL